MRQGTAFEGEVGDGDRDRRLANVLAWAKANGSLPAAAELAQIRSLLATYTRGLRTSTERLLDYAPGPVQAPVAYFRAGTSLVAYRRAFVDGAAWWRERATVFEPIDVPGDHYSMFLAPNVAALSAQLERVLAW
jgi:thioesterase domain-containing protein